MQRVLPLLLFALTTLLCTSTRAADIRELEERVKKLEERLVALEARSAPTSQPGQAPREIIDAAIRKARQRMAQDSKKYTREQLREAEQLYQVANHNWRSPEAQESLKKMVEKYPDVNRTGCAILYLGQMSEGAEREKHLKEAIEKYSDCFYGNGVQVGAFARWLLGAYYQENNQPEKAKPLLDELLKDYPNAIGHHGELLSKAVGELSPTPQPSQ